MAKQYSIVGQGGLPLYIDASSTKSFGVQGEFVNTGGITLYTLTAAAGSFAITGVAATLTYPRKITATVGSFAITGVNATLTYSGAPVRRGGGGRGMGMGGGFGGLGVRRAPFGSSSAGATRYLVICYGQSNMNGFFQKASSPPAANSGTYYYNGSATTSVPAANGIRRFMNTLQAATGKDCICFNGSINGTTADQLDKGYGSGYYESLLAQVQAVKTTGDVPIILWDQGEGDTSAIPNTEENVYKATLESIRSNFSTDLGVIGIPFFIGSLGYAFGLTAGDENGGYSDKTWHTIQSAHFNLAQELQVVKYSHSNIVASHTDGLHYDAAGQELQGKFFAQSVKAYLGYAAAYPHFEIASAATVDATHTDVTIAHSMGTDFTPTSGITAFEVSGDNGGTWSSATGARSSATVIRITHGSITTSNRRLVRYQYGIGWGQVVAPTEPDESNTVRDNSSLACPLTPTTWDIRPSALSTTPVLTHRYRTLLTGLTNGASVSNLPLGPEPIRKMVIIGIIGNMSQYFTSGTITPNVGNSVSLSLVKLQNNNIGIYQSVLGTDNATATRFRLDITTSQSLGGGFVRNVVTVDTVPYADLNSTTATTGGASASSNTVATATVNASASGFIYALASSSNITSNSGAFTGDETYILRNNNGTHKCTQKADASAVSANASSSVTITYANSGNIDLALASWR